MYRQKKILFIRNLTPMHVGSGNEIGIVDLPIQREKHTDFPKIEASSLKGSIREAFEKKLGENNLDIHLVFGYDEDADKNESVKNHLVANKNDRNTEYAGAVSFSDARLLFFPVKSAKNIFVWVTCPYALRRFNEDIQLINMNPIDLPNDLDNINNNPDFCIAATDMLKINNKIILEEYAFHATTNSELARKLSALVNYQEIAQKMVVVSDDTFKNFVLLSTEVITRTKIENETGTVKDGALFNEEYLPAESILYSLIFAAPIFNEVKNNFTDDSSVMKFITDNMPLYFQIGGNATLGKGIVKTNLLGG